MLLYSDLNVWSSPAQTAGRSPGQKVWKVKEVCRVSPAGFSQILKTEWKAKHWSTIWLVCAALALLLTSLSHRSLGGCISGDITPPTPRSARCLEAVIREACSAARWSIHITTFLSRTPADRPVCDDHLWTNAGWRLSLILIDSNVIS